MTKRIKFLDVAKGLLILIVVFHHVTLYSLSQDEVYRDFYNQCVFFYGSFFMPAFFLISGYCSNFNKNYKEFFINNLIGIIIPYFALGLINRIEVGLFSQDFTRFYDYFDLKFWLLLKDLWFLSVLFICKMIVFAIKKAEINRFFISSVLLFLCILGIWLGAINDPTNYFCYKHCLVSLFFVYLGTEMKRIGMIEKADLLYGAIAFIIIQIAGYLIKQPFPMFTWWIGIQHKYIPVFIVLALLGTSFIIWISQKINKNTVFEYFGRNSIIVYCLHMPFVHFFYSLFYIGDDKSPLLQISNSLIGFLFVCLAMLPIIALFNTRILKLLAGKR